MLSLKFIHGDSHPHVDSSPNTRIEKEGILDSFPKTYASARMLVRPHVSAYDEKSMRPTKKVSDIHSVSVPLLRVDETGRGVGG